MLSHDASLITTLLLNVLCKTYSEHLLVVVCCIQSTSVGPQDLLVNTVTLSYVPHCAASFCTVGPSYSIWCLSDQNKPSSAVDQPILYLYF